MFGQKSVTQSHVVFKARPSRSEENNYACAASPLQGVDRWFHPVDDVEQRWGIALSMCLLNSDTVHTFAQRRPVVV